MVIILFASTQVQLSSFYFFYISATLHIAIMSFHVKENISSVEIIKTFHPSFFIFWIYSLFLYSLIKEAVDKTSAHIVRALPF